MTDLKTVNVLMEYPEEDPLKAKQSEDVAKMRASLLACSDDPTKFISSMKTVTVLRVMHQVSRIVRYLDMMDKLEDKIYQSLDVALDNFDPGTASDDNSWMMLLNVQERLQRNLIDSHRLLEPYLNMNDFDVDSMISHNTEEPESAIISRETRDVIRTKAQTVLTLLNSED